jgi:transcriptional regulator with XRE-family HTH domain
MSDIGEKLLNLRTKRKFTLNEICHQVGIPPSRLVEIERGVRWATPGQIERLESFYEVKSGMLAGLAGTPETS